MILTEVVQQASAFITQGAAGVGLGAAPPPQRSQPGVGLGRVGGAAQPGEKCFPSSGNTSPPPAPRRLTCCGARYRKGRGLGKHDKGLVLGAGRLVR